MLLQFCCVTKSVLGNDKFPISKSGYVIDINKLWNVPEKSLVFGFVKNSMRMLVITKYVMYLCLFVCEV